MATLVTLNANLTLGPITKITATPAKGNRIRINPFRVKNGRCCYAGYKEISAEEFFSGVRVHINYFNGTPSANNSHSGSSGETSGDNFTLTQVDYTTWQFMPEVPVEEIPVEEVPVEEIPENMYATDHIQQRDPILPGQYYKALIDYESYYWYNVLAPSVPLEEGWRIHAQREQWIANGRNWFHLSDYLQEKVAERSYLRY